MAVSDTGENLTWEQIYPDTIRNFAVQEVEDEMMALECLNKRDISSICYQQVYKSVEGFMLDIKKLHSNFRRTIYDNDLSQNVKYIKDTKAIYRICSF